MKEYELTTGLKLCQKDLDNNLKKQFNNLELPIFRIDGTEEEIFAKLKLQLCFTFAMLYEQYGKNRGLEVQRLMKKYKIKPNHNINK
jgi:hypothetical protein